MRRLHVAKTDELRAALHSERGRSSSARLLHRLHCVFLVACGCSCYQVGGWFGEDRKTVERWVHEWNTAGVCGLVERRRSGRPPALEDAQLETLRADLAAPPRARDLDADAWSGPVLRQHLQRRFGIRLGVRQCQRLLRILLAAMALPGA